MNTIYLRKKMDEVRAMKKIEVDLSQEKIDLMMLIGKNYSTGKSFRECFNRKWSKRINRFSTLKNLFHS